MSRFHLERFKCGNTDDKLFHVWVAEGKYESWWLCILRMVFGIFCHVLSLFWWFVNDKKGCTRLASDKICQLLAHGRWFFPGTPASSTTKTGHHEIAGILLKVALKHKKSKSNRIKSAKIMFGSTSVSSNVYLII